MNKKPKVQEAIEEMRQHNSKSGDSGCVSMVFTAEDLKEWVDSPQGKAAYEFFKRDDIFE